MPPSSRMYVLTIHSPPSTHFSLYTPVFSPTYGKILKAIRHVPRGLVLLRLRGPPSGLFFFSDFKSSSLVLNTKYTIYLPQNVGRQIIRFCLISLQQKKSNRIQINFFTYLVWWLLTFKFFNCSSSLNNRSLLRFFSVFRWNWFCKKLQTKRKKISTKKMHYFCHKRKSFFFKLMHPVYYFKLSNLNNRTQ